MNAFPTWKTGLRPLLLLAVAASAVNVGAAAPPALSLQDLQRFGVQLKMASAQAESGQAPTPEALATMERQFAGFQDAFGTAGDQSLQEKYRSIARLLGKLQYQSLHAPAPSAVSARLRAQTDVEVVTDRHGGACAAALGISVTLPVQITAGQSGRGRSDAWLRFEPAQTGRYRFATNSMTADPAMEIFSGACSRLGKAIASNDDTFGLDAAASIAATAHVPLYIHLTNSGEGGAITLSVSDIGTVSGTITDAQSGLPIGSANVWLVNLANNYSGYSDYTDANGKFSIDASPDTYYVLASAYQRVTELYPNAQCAYGSAYYNIARCPTAQATSVSVTAGATVSNVNMALDQGQKISGTVRDGANQPVTNANLILYDNAGSQLNYQYADNYGRYSFSTLPSATYKLVAQAGGYGSQVFDHVACTGQLQTQCNPAQGTGVVVGDQDVPGINFSLPLLASIQGSVSPAPSYATQVCIVDAQGGAVSVCASTDANGSYKAGPLPVGTFYAYAQAPGYFSQIFDGVDCTADCTASLPAATQIVISNVGQIGIANFQLNPLPVVHGHVQDSISGLPLANVTIYASVSPPASTTVSTTTTDSNGDYSLTNTPAGKYYVLAQSDDHLDQIYSGVPCEQLGPYYYPATPCNVSGATLLTIASGQTPPVLDFALQPASSISGHAGTRGAAGSDLPAMVEVDVYNGAGTLVGTANTDASGNYVVDDLPAGTYFVMGNTGYYSYQFVTQIWQLIDCASQCAPTSGTPVPVGSNAAVSGVDFLMTRRDAVAGRITDDAGTPIAGVLVDLFETTTGGYSGTGVTDAEGYYATAANLGYAYFAGTESGGGYVDQVYSGTSCPNGSAFFGLCSFSNATSIPLSYGSLQPHVVNFMLKSSDAIYFNGFDSP